MELQGRLSKAKAPEWGCMATEGPGSSQVRTFSHQFLSVGYKLFIFLSGQVLLKRMNFTVNSSSKQFTVGHRLSAPSGHPLFALFFPKLFLYLRTQLQIPTL